ncbi:glycoside hydrolase [Actinoplanes sp. SE50]|uniref:glycoside hydrolase family 3 N-terminal domain-containing protein n=1 Tax=unclassified Actinoplanes TaxID=2626549 RepID=UPI00023EDF59|nr:MULTISPECIES: glycoside hydrolase family 3 N-terminal domain-containing protein [unclassified Actinoplanes]AEV88289.1 beta-N-acetylhexosaminidase [Actinoplanes sp. SE50/110]ATO86694.1 glycoside hydrolase [Actinoplanes sp. SE50]SLM04112.1 glycoside hydrolase [Actinoplanes sp. SE50/110]
MAIDPGLRRLALRTLLAAFPGTSAPDWALDLLADGLAGHTLFGTNVGSSDELSQLTARLRSARPDALIAIDEEGGDVTRLGHRTGSPYPGNAALGAADDLDLTRQVYAAIGADLATAGVNLDLAPTVDVNSVAENPIIGTRSFGADPGLVARHTGAAIAGLQSAGVAACAKHFPGHGATVTDSHLDLPTVDVPLPVLRERDLPPFAAAVAAGARAVMSAHIRVPALTGDGPATFSRAALQGLLRDEYGFAGVIVTDALEMRGAAGAAGGIPQAAVAALAAGADLLCIGAEVDRELVLAVADEVAAAVGDGRLAVVRLEQAAARNADLAAWAAHQRITRPAATTATAPGRTAVTVPPAPGRISATVPPAPDRIPATVPPAPDRIPATVPPAPDRTAATVATTSAAPGRTAATTSAELGRTAARRALLVEGDPAALAAPLVVQLGSGYSIAEGKLPWGLRPFLGAVEQIDVNAAETSADELIARAAGRPIVLVGRRVHQAAASRELAEKLAAAWPVAVVEMGWPSTWRPDGARAFLVTHGASLASAEVAAAALGLITERYDGV